MKQAGKLKLDLSSNVWEKLSKASSLNTPNVVKALGHFVKYGAYHRYCIVFKKKSNSKTVGSFEDLLVGVTGISIPCELGATWIWVQHYDVSCSLTHIFFIRRRCPKHVN
jgi:hypothetical protein